ncbi:MAG: hypothetical protein AB1473_23210 [Thermodesulfobacteriota bacterium]
MKLRSCRVIRKCWPGVVLALTLLLLDHGFGGEDGYDIWQPPSGQPEQMRSRVNYDPNLSDLFFESSEWSYPWWIIKHPDGHFEETTGDERPEEEPPRERHTAKCFSTGFGSKHVVEFCEARLVDNNTIDLLIHHTCPGFLDRLRVQVNAERFTCQYWTFYPGPIGQADFIWTTMRQKLTLEKQAFRKGDVIRGRIDFECLQEATYPKFVEKWGTWPKIIKLYGVFKTIVE